MIVRWSLEELPEVFGELGVERPFLLATSRWTVDVPVVGRWLELPVPEVEVPAEADSLLAWGGGSAIDTGKHASAETGLPLVSVPTTYSGAEWTTGYGIRTPDRHMVGGGAGAHPAGIVYEVDLTLDLPLAETVGTALNALAHCAEALYVTGRSDEADGVALAGAGLIARWMPAVVAEPHDRDARLGLLHGAAKGGEALALAGLGVAHAIAQTLGGRYGLPHGAMNALALPAGLRFAETQAPAQGARFRDALGGRTPEELARLGGFERLSQFGVPEAELPQLAVSASERPGNGNMPRPASAAELEELLRSIF